MPSSSARPTPLARKRDVSRRANAAARRLVHELMRVLEMSRALD
jgi:hypothetical protein